jgi:hypothetical protein
MQRMTWGLALAAALIVGVVVTGCGGSSSTTETTAALSKAEFLAKGNAVCIKGEKAQEAEINAYVKKHGLENKKPSEAQVAEIVETVAAPNIQGQIDGVKALTPPSSLAKQVETAIELAEEALEKVEANPQLFFSEAESPFAAAGEELHAVGLTKCAPNS